LTGRDRPVQRTVLRTTGVGRLLAATVRQVQAYAEGPSADRIVTGLLMLVSATVVGVATSLEQRS